MELLIDYLLFIGSGLYLASAGLFLFLFFKACKMVDGVGLIFFKLLTLSVALGSIVIFYIRIASEYFGMDMLVARAIAVFNPLLLVATAFYLFYFFNKKSYVEKTDTQNIKDIKKDIKVVKQDVKEVKEIIK